jgi:tRNA pseudouridine55 synthase
LDGVLVVDKPAGLTSHDVVAAVRRVTGEKRIGHTGTLDPMATGVLPLACGLATRLVRFLSASDKDYDAEIRFGTTTDTYDITGRPVGHSSKVVVRDEIDDALSSFRGSYLQAPPSYSAKKIGGRRAYDLARADVHVQPAPVPVHVSRLELVEVSENLARVRLTCSAGFYVRSLAHDLGARLGTGGCLAALRRTRSGDFDLASAVTLDALADRSTLVSRVIAMQHLLPGTPSVMLTDEGARWVGHGRAIGALQLSGRPPERAQWVRLLKSDGTLAALAEPGDAPGSLHPSIVLT